MTLTLLAIAKSVAAIDEISRDRLAELLNEDLAREYQAIIGYVVYSQVLSGAESMDIAAQLEIHAKQEGQFGENFTIDGLSDDEVCIGDRYRIGSALLEVTPAPRSSTRHCKNRTESIAKVRA